MRRVFALPMLVAMAVIMALACRPAVSDGQKKAVLLAPDLSISTNEPLPEPIVPDKGNYPPPFPGPNGVVTDQSPDMLVPPQGWKGEGYAIAATPPTVDAVLYSGLNEPVGGMLWSLWGQGCVASDGCFYSAIGDHGRVNAESYLYRYDPAKKVLRKVVGTQEVAGARPGDFGHGKIHGRIDECDGALYFATYWGSPPEEKELNERYQGGMIVQYNLRTGKSESLGTPLRGISYPIHVADRRRCRIYCISTTDSILGFDLEQRKTLFELAKGIEFGQRGIFCDEDTDLVYFPGQKKGSDTIYMCVIDPEKKTVRITDAVLPGTKQSLRATAPRKSADGWFYCSTFDGMLFRFDPKFEKIETLPNGPMVYTTSLALSPDDRFLYYVGGGAHGEAWQQGCPIVRYDLNTKKPKVVAFLGPYYEKKYSYVLGGTYGIVMDPAGKTLFVAMNGGLGEKAKQGGQSFGAPSVFVIHLPEG